jgi:hypothetical protein
MTAWLEVAGDAWSTMSLPRWKKAGGTSAREHSPLGRGLEAVTRASPWRSSIDGHWHRSAWCCSRARHDSGGWCTTERRGEEKQGSSGSVPRTEDEQGDEERFPFCSKPTRRRDMSVGVDAHGQQRTGARHRVRGWRPVGITRSRSL